MHITHLDQGQDGMHDGLFVLKPALLPQHIRQEVHERAVLGWELEAQ
jgi:hypothetical protein